MLGGLVNILHNHFGIDDEAGNNVGGRGLGGGGTCNIVGGTGGCGGSNVERAGGRGMCGCVGSVGHDGAKRSVKGWGWNTEAGGILGGEG